MSYKLNIKIYINQLKKLIVNKMDNLRSARQIQMKQKILINPTLENTSYVSLANLIGNSRSNTKFVIRYQQKQITAKSGHKINRYSSKHQHQIIKQNRISQSFLEKTKLKKKDGSSLPSYLRPTQSSISAQIQRNRIASLADMNNQHKNGAIVRLRSKSVEEQQQENDRQYNRIPIEFYDQKCYGCGADSVRARVVFRGYAPKNTYYYLKTLKPFKRKSKKANILQPQSSFSIGQQINNQKNQQLTSVPSVNLLKNELDIRFQSKFQSGNLSAASRISLHEYWLYMREDTNTHGLRQWYYFVVTNRKPIKVKFRIYKFTKSYSLYRMGMKPYIRTSINDILTQWQQGGEKIKYDYDNIQKCFYVEFQYKFQEENQEVQFAMLPPYTYSMLKDYMRSLPYQTLPQSQQKQHQFHPQIHAKSEGNDRKTSDFDIKNNKDKIKVQISTIGQSLAGLDIHLIQIKKVFDKDQFHNKTRQSIVILGRTHPGETVSNFSIESFIDTVLGSQQYVEYYDYFIVPMINPDGVYFGNHRTSIIGQDLNRNFNTIDFQVFPQIQAVHTALSKARKNHKIRYFIDLHGHSARKNIFAYGDQHEINTSQYLHTRILPKLLNDSISSFKYDYCIFRQSKQKKNTARVYYTNKYKINCLTIEQSYGILQEGPIGIKTWKNFGIALAQCLIEFAKLYNNGKQKMLEQYLADQIAKQKIQIQKRLQKHRKMLGITNQHSFSLNTTGMVNIPHNLNLINQKSLSLSRNEIDENQNLLIQHKQNHENIQKYQDQDKEQQNGQEKQQRVKNKQENNQQQKSISLSQLSSGDESLQNLNQQIEIIKKQIYKVGCMKQGVRRQKYNIADKKLRLFQQTGQYQDQIPSFRRMHQQKSSMIPRIAKLQLKRKQQYNLSFKKQFREQRRDILQRERQQRRRQIQAKFKKMELPSIRK